MKRSVGLAGVAAALALFLLAPEVRAAGECSDFISSGRKDTPLTGELTGQRMMTVSSTYTAASSWSTKLFGGSYSLSRTTTSVYWVGTYKMSDGTTKQVRCDTYRYA